MARPIIDKAKLSIDFPDKFYMGSFSRESRFDISADGSEAVVVTYRSLYRYRRLEGEDWLSALQRRPEEVVGRNPRVLKSGTQPAGFYEGLWRAILGGDDAQLDLF